MSRKSNQPTFLHLRFGDCAALLVCLLLGTAFTGCHSDAAPAAPAQSDASTPSAGYAVEEVVFWHFWGGADGKVVDSIVEKFHQSQDRYRVKAIAMPGNNLQAKLFLAVAGGDPPDLVNQDDPVLADWAQRGVIQSIESITPGTGQALENRMFPAAIRLSQFDGQWYAICNGLDVRALYYNKTALTGANLNHVIPPRSIQQLDAIAEHFAPTSGDAKVKLPRTVGYLPDTRRIWAWGVVFGGQFYADDRIDVAEERQIDSARVTITNAPIKSALQWMQGYGKRYGPDNLAAFRQGDQSLPGKTFPLLPIDQQATVGRYVVMMDGQWRVRDIVAFQEQRRHANRPVPEFGVCPLPYWDADGDDRPDPPSRPNAGWVNGNFFMVPRNANCPRGALEFAKFWVGLNDANQAADWYAAGGWVPVLESVAQSDNFQRYLRRTPLFRPFVELANSPHQYPIPPVVGAAFFKRHIESMAYEAVMQPAKNPDVQILLKRKQVQIQDHLDTVNHTDHPN